MAAHEELFVWEGDWGLPSVNSDCLVVLVGCLLSRFMYEAYAQFSGAPLKVHKLSNPWRCPGGTIPALRTAHKEALWRPSDIIVHLQKQKYNADFDLSPKEAADSLAFVALVQEKLSPAVLYALWVEPKNFAEVTRRWYAEHVSFPLGLVLPGRMRRQVLDKLRLLRGDASLDPGDELEKEHVSQRHFKSRGSKGFRKKGSPSKLVEALLKTDPDDEGGPTCLPVVRRRHQLHGPAGAATRNAKVLLWRLAFVSGCGRVWLAGTYPQVRAPQREVAATSQVTGQPARLLRQHSAGLFPPEQRSPIGVFGQEL
ncbi:metaxin-1 isoform X4 [Syngnathus scovelli]|uniref:metaxin-1 isoform X4 n=1 Tax=Syngnathus scovelli TaxID=161590 RepID=UPI002110266D|nr:metaxin-1 isoform X5 [Syngnathus scovelli]